MGTFAGLCSVAGLSLFLSWFLKRSSALMPLVAIAAGMVFFTLAGCLNVLAPAAWVWYGLCLAALAATIILKKGKIFGLVTPGFLFFLLGSALLLVVFIFTRPQLTHWDEFTFWGTAAKATSVQGQLYTIAESNLIARTYPPGLIVYSYMMQFFGGFTEPGYFACFGILYLACFAAAGALWEKQRTAAVLFFAALVLLPLFFEVNRPAGQMLWAYARCMADLPLAALFGGALGLYFAGGAKGARLLLPFGLVLAALVCVKDMGLALAAIALLVAAADMLFCQRQRLGFFRLRRWWALLAACFYCLVMVVGAYLLWWWHLEYGQLAVNRFEIGSYGIQLSMFEMIATGLKMLVGSGRSVAFQTVLDGMATAFFEKPVSLIGPGAAVLALIVVLGALAWGLAAAKRQRRRVLVCNLALLVGFAAFYVFNIFTYTFVFRPAEGLVLKDYQRYIMPYWFGWLMAQLVLLAQAATWPKATFYRLRVARGVAALANAALVLAVLVLGNWQGNFLRISPTQYGVRNSVNAVVAEAAPAGMAKDDVVYIISQQDDGTRFYMFGYQMEATRSLVYSGDKLYLDGTPVLDEAGHPVMEGNVATTLIPPGGEQLGPFSNECDVATLVKFFRLYGCTHLLLDVVDDYILDEFAPLFADGLEGWSADDPTVRGNRYYRMEWQDDGSCLLLPQTAPGEGGGL